jgi:hypothetical protein
MSDMLAALKDAMMQSHHIRKQFLQQSYGMTRAILRLQTRHDSASLLFHARCIDAARSLLSPKGPGKTLLIAPEIVRVPPDLFIA